MITVAGKTVQPDAVPEIRAGSTEKQVLSLMAASTAQFSFSSMERLQFELSLRAQTVAAARELDRSDLSFSTFRKSKCNPEFWDRTNEGGFRLKTGANAAAAILDIFRNGRKYATECATAMVIVYYRALLAVFGEEKFNRVFPRIELMNWHHLDRLIREVGLMNKFPLYLPGDRRYFANPDVDPVTPEWQGENVIDLDGRLYYGHGVGILNAEQIIKALNRNRIEDADDSAYLMDSAGRPDFEKLYRVFRQN